MSSLPSLKERVVQLVELVANQMYRYSAPTEPTNPWRDVSPEERSKYLRMADAVVETLFSVLLVPPSEQAEMTEKLLMSPTRDENVFRSDSIQGG